ncbi:MAG: SHOCT domain-containing protein [Solirubrobacterales bacterium]
MLRQLGELRDSGVLTEAEFEAKKAKILSASAWLQRDPGPAAVRVPFSCSDR